MHPNPLISLVFFFLLAQTSSSGTTLHRDAVRDTCRRCAATDPNVNYTLCTALFDSVPGSRRSDLKGLALISTDAAAASAAIIAAKLKTILDGNGGEKSRRTNSCLEACLELYSDSVSSLKDSAVAIEGGRYDDANVWLSSAVDAPGTCEDGFKEGGIESPLTEQNEGFFGRSVIALCVVAMLQRYGR